MTLFCTEEWAEEFVDLLNNNKEYYINGKDWNDTITFGINADDKHPENWYLYLKLSGGKCIEYKCSENLNKLPESTFLYYGTYSNWIKLIKSQIDPIQGLITGEFHLRGPMMKIMNYTKAAEEMVSTASKIKTEFL